ncbi:hypothetical protein BRARA_K00350 [Brassica rapa]|uniref:Embryo surrounding factor 1 brassicaceae domain-containing protein n=1 Tax=Brassica campestris TaxID=3711 RepID=A0A397L3L9_BRACM|nr:hypothetical protein BRARA_K00350 [Brassica rapa]
MKSGVLLATLLVIFMSCASNIFAKSFSEDKTDISSQACFMVKKLNLMLPIIHLDFCQECEHHCIRKKRFMLDCRSCACYCDHSRYNQRICTGWQRLWCINH